MTQKEKELEQVIAYVKAKQSRGGSRQNSGRQSKEPTETINFRIPISDKEKLKKLPISKLFKAWYKGLIE